MTPALPVPAAADWAAVGVETTLAATIVAVLVVPFFVRVRVNLTVGVVTIVGLLAAMGVAAASHPAGRAFGGMIVADSAASFWRMVLLAFTGGVVCLWLSATRASVPEGDGPEFVTLLLSATIGLSLMGATSNLLMLLLATELASLPSYVLAGFRKSQRLAAEASLKYVLFGAVCTATMIYGLSLLYGATGTLDAAAWAGGAAPHSPAAVLGMVLLGVGLLFKVAAVPVHFWCPDAFEGAGVDVAAFLSVASKGAAVVLMARLLAAVGGTAGSIGGHVAVGVAAVAVLTTAVGNLGALRQRSVKRLLAYSSIAHAGYLLSGLAVLPGGSGAVMIYVAVYAVMNLGAFAVLAGVERVSGSDDVAAFNGLNARAPAAAAAMAICLVSMVGLPPAVGFLAKWKIMAALAAAGGAWWWVVASVAINSVISLAFYARVLRAMYFEPAAADLPGGRLPGTAIAVTCGVLLIGSLIVFAPLDRWAGQLRFASTFDPAASE